MENKPTQSMKRNQSLVLSGISAGFVSGLFTGALAGVLLAELLGIDPAIPLGVGAYAFGGGLMGALAGVVIAWISRGIPSTRRTRWYWSAAAAAAAVVAVLIASRTGSSLPLGWFVLPLTAGVTGWVVENIVLVITRRERTRVYPTAPSLLPYLVAFAAFVALDILAILLYWEVVSAV